MNCCRNHFFQQIASDSIVSSYGLSNPAVTFKVCVVLSSVVCSYSSQSFHRFNSFKNSISAADVVIASSVLLDSYNRRKVRDANTDEQTEARGADEGVVISSSIGSDAFYEAYSCLSRFSDDFLRKGINNSLLIQKVVCEVYVPSL